MGKNICRDISAINLTKYLMRRLKHSEERKTFRDKVNFSLLYYKTMP